MSAFMAERSKLELAVYKACCTSPEGADFLVSSFVQALRCYRRPTVCAPFPSALFTAEVNGLVDKDFCGAEDATAHFPRVHAIATSPAPDWDAEGCSHAAGAGLGGSRDTNPVCRLPLKSLQLLHWILSAKRRMRLVRNPLDELSTLLGPGSTWTASLPGKPELRPHYILELQMPGDSEGTPATGTGGAFEEAKARGGSIFGFHGTSAENLHGILRCGLLNLSGTPLQRSGAVFGTGIYLSTDPSVALSFCSAGEGWERSVFGPRAFYLLLCEVALGAGVKGATPTKGSAWAEAGSSSEESVVIESKKEDKVPQTYILVKNSDLVKVRYVLVYTEPSRVAPRASGGGEGVRQRGRSSVSGAEREASETGIRGDVGQGAPRRRVDWCVVVVLSYVVMLLFVGLFNTSAYRHRRFLPYLQSLGW